ncbi:MAG: YbgA family protein [Halioglobus sp.]
MTDNNREQKPLLGIGSCLAGNAVRYNGQTKAPNQHVRAICEHFDARPFCPEMGIGLGVPRPPIHLVGTEEHVRVMDVETQTQDFTDPIRQYAKSVLKNAPELCGYILVKGSPSCGYGRVKRYSEKGNFVASDQDGVFTTALAEFDPLLALEDDGRLNDPGLRESFVTRARVYHEWHQLKKEGITAARLIDFYSRHKYLAMAHHVPSYKELGRLMADLSGNDLEGLAQEFITLLIAALKRPATRRSHSNVLFHIAGYLKRRIPSEQRQRLNELIEDYRTGQVPLVVPITMLRHHFADNPDAYINGQVWLSPYPDSLRIRNVI